MDKIELSPRIFNIAKMASEILSTQGLTATFEIYQLSALEQAMSQEELHESLTDGLAKPWEVPVAYAEDWSNNIVLFRIKEVEDYLKDHSCALSYGIPKFKNGQTIQNLIFNMLYIGGEPYWKTWHHEGPKDDLPF